MSQVQILLHRPIHMIEELEKDLLLLISRCQTLEELKIVKSDINKTFKELFTLLYKTGK